MKLDVTKLMIDSARCTDHVRLPTTGTGVSMRSEGDGKTIIDWEHRCMIHLAGDQATVVPFENVMYISCHLPPVDKAKQ